MKQIVVGSWQRTAAHQKMWPDAGGEGKTDGCAVRQLPAVTGQGKRD